MHDAQPAVAACEEVASRHRVFSDFMTKVAGFEELVDAGKRLLAIFRRELEVHSCQSELEDHINEVKALLKEFQCVVQDAYDTTLTASLSALKVDSPTVDDMMSSESFFMEAEEKEHPSDQLGRKPRPGAALSRNGSYVHHYV